MRGRRLAFGLVIALLVLALDQASKFWVLHGLALAARGPLVLLPVLNFVLVWNRGVTFGMLNGLGAWASPALILGALVIVAALGAWLYRAENALTAGALGAIAGGALGNIIDRLRFGAVVDFIQAHIGRISWYVFNLPLYRRDRGHRPVLGACELRAVPLPDRGRIEDY